MNPRPTIRVAHWLACTSAGLIAGAATQSVTEHAGAAPGTLLGATSLSLTLVAAVGLLKKRRVSTLGLIAFPLGVFHLETIEEGITWATHRTLGATTETWLLAALVLGASALPAILYAQQSTSSSSARSGAAPLSIGLLAGGLGLPPTLAATVGATLLWLAAREPRHRSTPLSRAPVSLSIPFTCMLAGAWLSTGWVHLRTVFNPTLSAFVVLAATAALASPLGKNVNRLLWSGVVGTALWSTNHLLSYAAPQLGALALAQAEPLWFIVPFVVLGLITGPLTYGLTLNSPTALVAFGIGLWAGPVVASQPHVPWIAVGLLGLASLFSSSPLPRVLGAALGATIILIDGWRPAPASILTRSAVWSQSSQTRQLAQWATDPEAMQVASHGLTDSGAFVTWRADEQSASGFAVELDGLNATDTGPQANAEEMVGHLAALLAPAREPMLVIGDAAGNVLRGLAAHPPGLVHVATPSPFALRSLASIDPVRSRLWLQPTHPLYPEHPARLISRMTPVAAIAEVLRAPWTDGSNWGMSSAHLGAIRRRLVEDGVYVLIIHTRFFNDGQVAEIGRMMTEEFDQVQLWLAPEGVESLTLVASDGDLNLSRLEERFAPARTALEQIGFPTAGSLAGAALLNSRGVAEWARRHAKPLTPHQIGDAAIERPTLHLTSVAEIAYDTQNIWTSGDAPSAEQVRKARLTWLKLIQQASSGDLEGAFSAAQSLAADHGEIGEASLTAIIMPHIEDGQRALRTATRGEPGSRHWDDALRFATTARMLAPSSHLPLTLLGDISLAQGRLPKAIKEYQSALAIKPDHIPALEGMARWARLSQSPKQAEQALRSTTRHAPRDWRTWHNLAVFLMEQDRTDEALKAAETSLGLAPATQAAPAIAMTTLLLDTGSPGAALLRADAVTKSHPDNAMSWYLRGRAHFDLNRAAEAEEDFRKAVLIDPDLVEARSGIGLLRAMSGDQKAAAAIFRDILNRDPGNSAARENLRRLGETGP